MKLKSLQVKPFRSDPFILQSKSSLKPEQVFDILTEENLYFNTYNDFLKEIWELLTLDIIVYKHYTIQAYLIPYMEISK